MALMGYVIRNIYFSLREIIRNLARALFSSFGIIFLIAFLVVYLSLRQSIKEYIGGNLFGTMKINDVVVTPKAVENRDFFAVEQNAAAISHAAVRRIGRMPGVENMHTVIRLDYATKIRAEMLGNRMREYLPIFGISREFLRTSEKRWSDFRASGTQVPVLISKMALDILNSVVEGRGLPQFGEKILLGFPMEIEIQTSPRGDPAKKRYKFTGKVYGFTSAITLAGLIVPSDFITQFSVEHRNDSSERTAGYSYVKIFLSVKNVKELPEITRRIQAMGLAVESQQEVAAKTNRALTVIDSSSFLIIGIFLILTVISIFNSYLTIVYHRSHQFALQRVIGVSKLRIISTFVAEAALVGFIYGVIGYFGGLFIIRYVSVNIGNWVPALKGLTFSGNLGENVLLMSAGFSALLSSVSAFVPAVFASNMNLFRAVQR